MINLSITALLLSSYSYSPQFTSTANYRISSCNFVKNFQTIFYIRSSLKCSDSYFSKSLASIIDVNNYETSICPSGYGDITYTASVDLYRDTANNCGGVFTNFINIQTAVNISIVECLFYNIHPSNSLILVQQDSTTSYCNIEGNCFSNIISKYVIYFQDITTADISQYSIEVIGTSFHQCQIDLGGTVTSSGVLFSGGSARDFQISNSNFSNNVNLNGSLIGQKQTQGQNMISNIQFCDIYSNSIGSVYTYCIYNRNNINDYNPTISITRMTCLNNTINRAVGETDYCFTTQMNAIYWIFSSHLTISNCAFVNFTAINDPNRQIYLFGTPTYNFAQVTAPTFLMSDCIFTYYTGTYANFFSSQILYTFDGEYNNVILNANSYATVPFSMNEYLHDVYSPYCPIYYTPNTPTSGFTQSDIFTASSHFTASNPFTGSNSFTPPPPPPATTKISVAISTVGAIGGAVVSFGLSSIIWVIFKRCCQYDRENYLQVEF